MMQDMAVSSGGSIRKNTFLNIVISGIGYLYPVLVFVYIARIFQPDGLGRISFASSVAAYFVLFTGLGMPIYGLRAAAAVRNQAKELSRLAAEMIIIRALSGILVWGVYLRAVATLGWPGDDRPLLMVFGFGILAAVPDCSWMYRGLGEYSSLVWISAAVRLCGLAVLFFLVREASDILVYAWIAVLTPLGISLAELVLAERKWKLRILPRCWEIIVSGETFRAVRKHIRPLALFLLMSCAVMVYGHTDTVMLRLMKDERTVGLYSCAAKIKTLLPVLTGALWAATLPKSAELWKRKKIQAFRELSERSFHAVVVFLLPLAVYFFLFAEPWIVLIGGAEYLEAAVTMRLLLPAVVPIGFSNIIGGQMLIPMGQEKKLFQAEAIGATSNIAFNAILIPLFAAPGAAIATTVSEILVTLVAGHMMLKRVKVRMFRLKDLIRSAVGCMIASLGSFGIASLFPEALKGPLSFVLFVTVFGMFMLGIKDSLYRDMFISFKKICPAFLRRVIKSIIRAGRTIRYQSVAILFPERMNVFCPCCGIRFRSFAEGNYIRHPELFCSERYQAIKQDVICPVCQALPRHRILASWCEEHKSSLQSADILYFAAERCMMRWMKRNGVSCTTADLFQKADLKLDITDTRLPDESYDVVFCNHVLEHVEDYRAALHEIWRILKPNGFLICSFPMDPKIDLLNEETGILSEEERIRRFGQYDHKRVFGMHADQLLVEARFQTEKISGEVYPKEIMAVVGPADYDINWLFCCRKGNPLLVTS